MNKFGGIFFTAFFMLLIAAMVADDSVEQAFVEHEVVPDVIPIAPEQKLKVTYDGGLEVKQGNELTPTQVKSQPKLEWEADADCFYTVIMTDPDAPSRLEPKVREFKHWIVGNIPGTNVDKGDVLAAYVGSGPPEGTGLHRYVFLVYKQPAKIEFEEVRVGNDSREGRPKFKAADFAKKYGLGDPVAGNFYQAEYDDYVPTVHKQLSGNQ